MKNKLVFRILGALASALVIVSVFVPFVSVTGYSQSLWQFYELISALYLPIMIIVFGAIGVIVFAMNIKTELAYTSSGALLFFILTQTIPTIQDGTLDAFGMGYYFLVIGTVLTGIMTFLCNLRVKKKISAQQNIQTSKEVSVIDQINKLYDNQTPLTNVQDSVIQPISVPTPVENNVNPIPVAPSVEPLLESNSNVNIQNSIPEVAPLENASVAQSNIPIPEINVPMANNNLVESNPVISEFNQPTINQDVSNSVQMPSIPEINFSPENVNPVVSEFSNANPQMNSQSIMPQGQSVIQPLNGLSQSNTMNQPSNNGSNLDIFG